MSAPKIPAKKPRYLNRNRQKCQAARACVPQPDANIPGRALRIRGIGYRLGATERTVSVSPSTEKRTSQPPKAMP